MRLQEGTKEAFEKYQRLLQELERLTERLTIRYAPYLACGKGCSSCCRHSLSVFLLESVLLEKAIRALPVEILERLNHQRISTRHADAGDEKWCPLLLDGACAIYDQRPVICRTQGLPLLIQEEEGIYVDFCPLNFVTRDARETLSLEYLVPLDAINLQLALANLHFCRLQGIPDRQSWHRIPLLELLSSLVDPKLER